MRALLRLAMEKGVIRELAWFRSIGLLPPETGAAPSAGAAFARQEEEI